MYKREIAYALKQEFPQMNNEERAQIVRERWRSISDSLKAVYVTMARFEQEIDRHTKVQRYFSERIATAKAHSLLATKGGKRLQCFEALSKVTAVTDTDKPESRSDENPPANNQNQANSTCDESSMEARAQ